MRSHDVLIAGGGPIGLILALILGEAGLAVQLVDPAISPKPDAGAAILLPSALDALDRLALAKSLVAESVACRVLRERLEETGDAVEFDLALIRDATGHPFILQCDMSSLIDIVRTRLGGCPNVRFQTGARVVGLTETGDEVEVTIESEGERFIDSARIVAGCDGPASAIRQALGIGLESGDEEDVRIESLPLDASKAPLGSAPREIIWRKDGGEIALMRLPAEWRSVSSPAKPANGVKPDRSGASCASRFAAGRVALAGAAAHQTWPEGEAALSAGIGDAVELARAIIDIHLEGGDIALLERYGEQRLTAARAIVKHEAAMIRRRHENRDPTARRGNFAALRALAADPARCRAELLGRMMLADRPAVRHFGAEAAD